MVAKSWTMSLPTPAELEQRAKALAMLECILGSEPEYRYFTYDAAWSETERLGRLDNGSGDTVYLVFAPHGTILFGFDHESAMSPAGNDLDAAWPGVLDAVPAEFQAQVEEPAFDTEEYITFCLWRTAADTAWQVGEIDYPEGDADADGSSRLLDPYVEGPEDFVDWASGYHEAELPLDAVAKIYAMQPLDETTARAIKADIDWEAVKAEAIAMKYPVA